MKTEADYVAELFHNPLIRNEAELCLVSVALRAELERNRFPAEQATLERLLARFDQMDRDCQHVHLNFRD